MCVHVLSMSMSISMSLSMWVCVCAVHVYVQVNAYAYVYVLPMTMPMSMSMSMPMAMPMPVHIYAYVHVYVYIWSGSPSTDHVDVPSLVNLSADRSFDIVSDHVGLLRIGVAGDGEEWRKHSILIHTSPQPAVKDNMFLAWAWVQSRTVFGHHGPSGCPILVLDLAALRGEH